MRAYIKKLQSKSEIARKQIFVGLLILGMVFTGAIWVYGLGHRLSDGAKKEQVREDVKPFRLFANSISGTYDNISASVGKIKIKDNVQPESKVESDKQVDLVVVEQVEAE